MRKSKVQLQLISVAIAAVIVILACGPAATATPTLDPNAVSTAIHQTMIAHTLAALDASQSANQGSSGDQQQGQQQQPPTETFTVAVVTETPSLTPQPPNTNTPSVPMVSVSVDTNCRFGPGKGYELLGALLVGEQAEIVARDPSGLYWYIKNPDRGGFCWLWGNYATTTGNVGSLPVFTPPATPTFTPTPTPVINYKVSFHQIEGCVGWELEFKFTNNGDVIFQSVSIVVTDNDTAQTVATNADKFEERNGCLVAGGFNDLDPGDTGYAVGGVLVNDPAGHSIDATVKLCTEPGLGGTCVTKNLSFTP
jgi:hypothetical protein